jgi:hypothetical protein
VAAGIRFSMFQSFIQILRAGSKSEQASKPPTHHLHAALRIDQSLRTKPTNVVLSYFGQATTIGFKKKTTYGGSQRYYQSSRSYGT